MRGSPGTCGRRIDRRIQPIFNAQTRFNGGARLEARGRLPDALEAYRGARRIMPHNGTIHAALGRTAHSLGRNALARRYSRTAVRLLEEEQARHPEDPNIDILLAQCLARLGEKDRAEAHLRAGFFRRRSFIADGD